MWRGTDNYQVHHQNHPCLASKDFMLVDIKGTVPYRETKSLRHLFLRSCVPLGCLFLMNQFRKSFLSEISVIFSAASKPAALAISAGCGADNCSNSTPDSLSIIEKFDFLGSQKHHSNTAFAWNGFNILPPRTCTINMKLKIQRIILLANHLLCLFFQIDECTPLHHEEAHTELLTEHHQYLIHVRQTLVATSVENFSDWNPEKVTSLVAGCISPCKACAPGSNPTSVEAESFVSVKTIARPPLLKLWMISGISWDLAELVQGRTICLTIVLAFIFSFPTRSAVFLSGFKNILASPRLVEWH